MNLLQIVDAKDGTIEVLWQKAGNDFPLRSERCPFCDPLNEQDRSALRWYLEEYLSFPYGAERDKAARIAEKIKVWGAALFEQVFAFKNKTMLAQQDFYKEANRMGLGSCELCIVSEDAIFLSIPWEILYDDSIAGGYVSPMMAGMYRCHDLVAQPNTKRPEVNKGPLRVLLVVARPYGERDIGYRTIARPMLEALRSLQTNVELEILRPPTFDEFQKKLGEKKNYYHIVHFDGHGDYLVDEDGTNDRGSGIGCLVFENEDGTDDIVTSTCLGDLLAECGVPFFVLNACRSAEVGKQDAFSSVASQLISIGAQGVIAMSYSVYADAAVLFMQCLYKKLVSGDSLVKAMTAARRKLMSSPDRQSVIGKLQLQDWMLPVLYQQCSDSVLSYVDGRLENNKAHHSDGKTTRLENILNICPEGQYGFIGRDYDFLRIERALRNPDNHGVILYGTGGVGKTELAYGFARWYYETGGCSGGVFVTNFKYKADLGQIIGAITGFGKEFSQFSEKAQCKRAITYLKQNSCLLILDNVETVAGYPGNWQVLASTEEKEKIDNFLRELRGGKSRVLLTTRKPVEEWLTVAYSILEVKGLVAIDAEQMANRILTDKKINVNRFQDDPRYSQLIKYLNGHPRSMESVLPLLRQLSPQQIIDAIDRRAEGIGARIADASLECAIDGLSEIARRHLPFIGMFTTFVLTDTLTTLFTPNNASGELYLEIQGVIPDRKTWEVVLTEAVNAGLMCCKSQGIYQLPPTLPPVLYRQFLVTKGEANLRRLENEFIRFYSWLSEYLREQLLRGNEGSLIILSTEEGNFLRALRLAVENELWKDILYIVRSLGRFYESRGRYREGETLCAELLKVIGREVPSETDRERGNLWVYLLGEKTNVAIHRNDLTTAQSQCNMVIAWLTPWKDENADRERAVAYYRL